MTIDVGSHLAQGPLTTVLNQDEQSVGKVYFDLRYRKYREFEARWYAWECGQSFNFNKAKVNRIISVMASQEAWREE